jgi:hypothetical protein
MRLLLPCLFFLCIASVLLPSCRAAADDEPVIIVSTEPEFVVDLFEHRDAVDGHPTFGLWVETLRDYDCAGYVLDAPVVISASSIDVEFRALVRPDPCVGPPQPVRQFVPVAPLAGSSYRFVLHLGQPLANEGELAVSDGLYSLSMPGPLQGVDFRQRALRHIPDSLVWGYVRLPSAQADAPAAAFIADLKTLSAEAQLTPAYYGYFTVTGTQDVLLHPAFAPAGNYLHFVRRLAASPDELRGLLQQYRSAGSEALEVQCWSSWGEL